MTDLALEIAGVYRPRKGPGFAIPVFWRDQKLCVQDAPDGVVAGFRFCDIERGSLLPLKPEDERGPLESNTSLPHEGRSPLVRQVGQPKLHAFVFSDRQIALGERVPLARTLREAAPIEGIGPFGELDVAEFVGDAEWVRAARAATERLLPNAGLRPRKPEEMHPWWWRMRALPQRAVLLSIVASLFAVIGVWYLTATHNDPSYSTHIGEQRQITLEDGSTVTLNTDTELRVRYTSEHRRIDLLRGEAFFEVAENKERPFEVVAGTTTVRAVGTAFAVRVVGSGSTAALELVVAEGRVSVGPPFDRTYDAGSAAHFRNGIVEDVVSGGSDITARLAWTEGRLVFNGATLASVVDEFNRYNTRKIRISDPAVASIHIGGNFTATEPDAFAAALDRSFGIKARLEPSSEGDLIVLYQGPQ